MNRWREKFPAGFRFFVLLGAAGFAISSCGLEEYIFLYPPSTSKDTNIFSFANNPVNDPAVFYGYRILYRFYPSEESANSGISSVTSLYSSFPTTIYGKMKSSLGFRDLKISDEQKTSLIIDSGNRQDSFTVDLDFGNAGQPNGKVTIKISSGVAAVTDPSISPEALVYRSVSGLVGFSSEALISSLGYEDLVEITNYDSLTGSTYLLLYVIAFGYNATFVEVYSEPKYFVGSTSYINLQMSDIP